MIAFLLLMIAEAFLIYSFVLIQYKKELQTVETVVVWLLLQGLWLFGLGWWLGLLVAVL